MTDKMIRNRKTQSRPAALAFLAMFAMAAGVMFGQGVTGRIQGTVRDQSHATIPGAAVTYVKIDKVLHIPDDQNR